MNARVTIPNLVLTCIDPFQEPLKVIVQLVVNENRMNVRYHLLVGETSTAAVQLANIRR